MTIRKDDFSNMTSFTFSVIHVHNKDSGLPDWHKSHYKEVDVATVDPKVDKDFHAQQCRILRACVTERCHQAESEHYARHHIMADMLAKGRTIKYINLLEHVS